jgi:hypothetical protein
MAQRLGQTEVDHLGDRLTVLLRDEDVGGFDIAVDDSLLMRVLNGLTDGYE